MYESTFLTLKLKKKTTKNCKRLLFWATFKFPELQFLIYKIVIVTPTSQACEIIHSANTYCASTMH